MNHVNSIVSKIVDKDKASAIIKSWKEKNELIVFTNGCFDIIHKGHIMYLAKAKELGARLVVGLNSDASVTRLKGQGRPIKEQESRELTLAAFSFVDMVVPFEEDTPYELISALLPNILVKGKDYNENDIIGADIVKKNGGSVKTIDLEAGFSSTKYVKKL